MEVLSELQARASECRKMAQIATDPQSTAVWQRMAERWERMLQRAAKHCEDSAVLSGASPGHIPTVREDSPTAKASNYVVQACVSVLDQSFRRLALEPLSDQHQALLEALESRLARHEQEPTS